MLVQTLKFLRAVALPSWLTAAITIVLVGLLLLLGW